MTPPLYLWILFAFMAGACVTIEISHGRKWAQIVMGFMIIAAATTLAAWAGVFLFRGIEWMLG